MVVLGRTDYSQQTVATTLPQQVLLYCTNIYALHLLLPDVLNSQTCSTRSQLFYCCVNISENVDFIEEFMISIDIIIIVILWRLLTYF